MLFKVNAHSRAIFINESRLSRNDFDTGDDNRQLLRMYDNAANGKVLGTFPSTFGGYLIVRAKRSAVFSDGSDFAYENRGLANISPAGPLTGNDPRLLTLYAKARLRHLGGDYASAKDFYNQTVAVPGVESTVLGKAAKVFLLRMR